jgi:hypothetical protein
MRRDYRALSRLPSGLACLCLEVNLFARATIIGDRGKTQCLY